MKPEKKDKTYRQGRGLYQILSVIVLAVLLVAGTAALGPIILRTAQNPEQFRDYIDSYGFAGRLLFIGIQMLQVIFALIPGEVIEVGAGYAFGPWQGLLLCMIGVFLASTLIFFLVRKAGRRLAEILMSSQELEKLKFLHNSKQLNLIVFLLYFIPGTPKDLLTFFVGLTEMKPSSFLWMTTLARIPSILSSTYAGSSLNEKNYVTTIIIFSVSAVVSLFGILLYRYITQKHERNAAAKDGDGKDKT